MLLRLWFLVLCVLAGAFASPRANARAAGTHARQNEVAGQKLAPGVFESEAAILRQAAAMQAAELQQGKSGRGYELAPGFPQLPENLAGFRTQIAGKGQGGHHLVDRVAGEIEGAVRQADRVLQVGGTGGTRWGAIYQHYAGTGHWLEPVARGNALQSIVNARLANNTYIREAGVLFNQGSLRGLRSSNGALLRPDFQIPLSSGKLGIIDLTTPGQAPKISKYADPQTPFLLNVLYGQ